MRNTAAGLDQLFSGRARPTNDQVDGAMEGTVIAVNDGKALFVIPDFTPELGFDPAPYGRTSTPPQAGDRCLVMFVGKEVNRPWLIAWAPAE